MQAEEIRALKPDGNLFDFAIMLLKEIAAQLAEMNARMKTQPEEPRPHYEKRRR